MIFCLQLIVVITLRSLNEIGNRGEDHLNCGHEMPFTKTTATSNAIQIGDKRIAYEINKMKKEASISLYD